MKYNIVINQKAIIDNGLDKCLDLVDFAIFDFIYHFVNSNEKNIVRFYSNNIEYVDIRFKLVSDNLPLANVGTRQTFNMRMNKLISARLLDRYENNSLENKSGYCRGPKFSVLEFVNSDRHPVKQNDTPDKDALTGCQGCFNDPVKGACHNNSINNNNINYNTNMPIGEAPLVTPQQDRSCVKESLVTWRSSFDEYLNILRTAYRGLLEDDQFRLSRINYYPNLDYKKTLEKMCKDFWATDQGWKNKLKTKSKTIDMTATLKKGFDLSSNRVYTGKTFLLNENENHQQIKLL